MIFGRPFTRDQEKSDKRRLDAHLARMAARTAEKQKQAAARLRIAEKHCIHARQNRSVWDVQLEDGSRVPAPLVPTGGGCVVIPVPSRLAHRWFKGLETDGALFRSDPAEFEPLFAFVMALNGVRGVREMLFRVGELAQYRAFEGVICRTKSPVVERWLKKNGGQRGSQDGTQTRWGGGLGAPFLKTCARFYAWKKQAEYRRARAEGGRAQTVST